MWLRTGQGDGPLPGDDGGTAARIALAVVLATTAFWAYTRTLLPGVDLGDTGGFQAAVLWPETSARTAYPLYYSLARPFVRLLSASNAARGLNLFSAVTAAAAVGLLALTVMTVTRSRVAGAVSGLLLAFSYTFWTQAVTAEVYGLHLALVAACLLALHAFAVRPDRLRLAIFFAVYALSFGNHLSMILFLAPFSIFLLWVHPRRAELFLPSTVALATAIAAAGALQYLPNLLAEWRSIDAPPAWRDRLAIFWVDVTKADWRATMVLGIEPGDLRERLAMWYWDMRQQFGLAGVAVVCAGAARLWTISRPWAVAVWLAYASCTLFALTYNVGDVHVFFLPGHLFAAFAAGAAVAPYTRHVARRRLDFGSLAGIAMLAYAAWVGWDTWPAADRHRDRRGEALVAGIVAGLDERSSVLISHLNWQQENAILYASRQSHRHVAWVRLGDVFSRLPSFVRDNQEIGRDLVLTEGAAARIVAALDGLFSIVPDDRVPAPPLETTIARIPRGAPYVITLLTPMSEYARDGGTFERALALLAGSDHPANGGEARAPRYRVVAGLAGDRPLFDRSLDRPFRDRFTVLGEPLTIRFDGWLPADTFRRGGFGHVIRGRQPVLFVERGLSLVWFGRDGSPQVHYAAGLYAPQQRFVIPSVNMDLAERSDHRLPGSTVLSSGSRLRE